MHSDDVIEALGGMSSFQVLMVFGIIGPKIIMVGGMLMMAFAAVPPDHWGCVDTNAANINVTEFFATGSAGLNHCPSGENRSKCTFVYSTEKYTIINEWELLCDRKQIPLTIIAVQMLGVLIGCMVAGQLADAIGRKKTYYLYMVLHATFNLVAVFSVSWQMFMGISFIPESLRWLAVHGRLQEAEKVVDQMSRYNGRKKPENTAMRLRLLRSEELKARKSGAKYSYIDIYRGWKICSTSLLKQLMWFCVSFTFYGISFGVGRLTGNLYLNMFLIGLVDVPALALSYFLNNRIGRRWSGFFFFAVATSGALGVAVVSKVDSATRGRLTTSLALVCRMGVAAAWCTMQIHTTETYPTPIRNMGYGAASVVGWAGSIISPYAFAIGSGDDLCPSFLIVGSTMALCTLLTLVLEETLGVPLKDTTKNLSVRFHKQLTEEELNDISVESTQL